MALFRKYSHSYSCDVFQAWKENQSLAYRLTTRWKRHFLKRLLRGDIPNEPGHLQFFIEQWMIDHQPTAISIDKDSVLNGVESIFGWPVTLPAAISICPAPTIKAAGLPLPTIFVATNFSSGKQSFSAMANYVLQREGFSAPMEEDPQPLVFVNYHDARETIVTGSRVHTALTDKHFYALATVSSAAEYDRAMQSLDLPLGIQQQKTLETMYLVHCLVASTLQNIHRYGLPTPGIMWTRLGGQTVRFREYRLNHR